MMRTQERPESEFARRLRGELRQIVAERAAEQSAGPPRGGHTEPPSRGRLAPRIAFAVVAVVAIVAAVLIVNAGGGDTSSAFAVEAGAGGDIRVEITGLEDAKGLEEALDARGVQSSVTYLPAGKTCKEPRFQKAEWPRDDRVVVQGEATPTSPVVFSVSGGAVGPGQTLVVTAAPDPGSFLGVSVALAEGAVAACAPVPAA